ncbi:hypothetical protein M758_12G037200 [Ceratodon purpureus]|uniref:DNA-directed RNA polymerase III subunit n=1 Tax=Ceratodon purpureus TaxID=3225 RepID=A0A8T0G5Q1_CERPU|nr:hypothetical protein KC19_N001400 [Ceratodon purpureus]KAG0553756.1 hypothetical protein KC19_12G036600 [Ceratodon purpureus]KAG0553757.1 hypothetical protein KC19_12G036600 [Ceratodon purpureus]KAG0553758.1 hypothetical protein KC19_12G036600 [Ceratodon purpureus]KAG0553759.1 hypothetical protein KC19_12G036600 [Ceratodon purpureus]
MAARGRGRGRGRGGGGGAQFLPRDDDGNIVFNKKQEGPPPLFPKIERLPDLPTISKRDEMLVARRHQLQKAWECSPYYIEKAKAKSEGIVAEIERYSDRYRTNKRANRVPLNSVLKLNGASFPVELLGQGRGRGRGVLPPGSTPWLLQNSLAKTDLLRLDQLASLEQKRLKDEEKGDKDGEEKKPGEGEEGDGENEELEDEEEELGDDDYAQTFGFDDDEEYEMDDGGDDEGPVF